MKKWISFAVAVILLLVLALPVFAQPADGDNRGAGGMDGTATTTTDNYGTYATANADNDMDWLGWFGLLGLFGLLGRNRERNRDIRR